MINKLSQSQTPSDATYLKSSATLGSKQHSTAGDKLALAEHMATKNALKKSEKRMPNINNDDYESDEDAFLDEIDNDAPVNIKEDKNDKPDERESAIPNKDTVTKKEDDQQTSSSNNRNETGSALAGGSNVNSIIKHVTKPRKKLSTISRLKNGWKQPLKDDEEEEEDYSSFDSSASSENGENGESDDGEESENSDEDDNKDDENDENDNQKRRKLGTFKNWALEQMNNKTPSQIEPINVNTNINNLPSNFKKPSGPSRALAGKINLPSTSLLKELDMKHNDNIVKTVNIQRSEELQASRLLLPVVESEHEIVETILLNPVTVLCGETGSGKTTQIPQFLYERGFGTDGSRKFTFTIKKFHDLKIIPVNPGMMAITQPRRVAAVSMANRVGQELGIGAPKVAYKIRYDGTTSPETSIKFMTDGVLLRELAHDFLLSKYSVIIVDEAHERSVNTDILIGILSRVVNLRNKKFEDNSKDNRPLRLIIMSATLRVSDFTENKTLFKTAPPVINIGARQHPVTVHFSKRTSPNYIDEAMAKTVKIHKRLPPGGILIFLTGQGEIESMARKLSKQYGQDSRKNNLKNKFNNQRSYAPNAAIEDIEIEEVELGNDEDPALEIDESNTNDEDEDEGEESGFEEALEDENIGLMHVLPLYSLLPSEKQMEVFKPPPQGSRLVVLATNVAETSITIPGIRYVIDSGRAKERVYNSKNGIQSFDVSFIPKSSAAQRAGRSGRTGPGHTYRLYSSAVFENYFDQFSQPEILKMPIEGLVLQMKSMNIDVVQNFPFPTKPNDEDLSKAEKLLTSLGCLTNTSNLNVKSKYKITELGRSMSLFPVNPRFSKMLVTGSQYGCLPYVIGIVSALSVGDPFVREESLNFNLSIEHNEDYKKQVRKQYFVTQSKFSSLGDYTSDHFKLLSAIGAYEYSGGSQMFCKSNFLINKSMEEIRKLRSQLSQLIQSTFPNANVNFTPKLSPPDQNQQKVLKQLITSAFIDQVAVRKDLVESDENRGKKFTNCRGIPYKAIGVEEDVFIHPSSVVFDNQPPEYIVYNEIISTSQPYMKGITTIQPSWLSILGKNMCSFSKPVEVPTKSKLKTSENTKEVLVEPYFGPGRGIKLPPVKMTQIKDKNGRWILQ